MTPTDPTRDTIILDAILSQLGIQRASLPPLDAEAAEYAAAHVVSLQQQQLDAAEADAARLAATRYGPPAVGGDPPVPEVGWIAFVVHISGRLDRYEVESVHRADSSWSEFRATNGIRVYRHDVSALYRLGDSAEEPCWRRE